MLVDVERQVSGADERNLHAGEFGRKPLGMFSCHAALRFTTQPSRAISSANCVKLKASTKSSSKCVLLPQIDFRVHLVFENKKREEAETSLRVTSCSKMDFSASFSRAHEDLMLRAPRSKSEEESALKIMNFSCALRVN
jgi:hypothetical protein